MSSNCINISRTILSVNVEADKICKGKIGKYGYNTASSVGDIVIKLVNSLKLTREYKSIDTLNQYQASNPIVDSDDREFKRQRIQ